MNLSKIKVHPFTLLMVVITIITGTFKEMSYSMILLLIHEIGHILGGIWFHWNIEKVVILPFGGLTIFKEWINKPMKEELIITLLGPLFQILGFLILKNFITTPSFTISHYTFLIFNLLPIYPLDGSKLSSILLNYVFSFQKSHSINIVLSIFSMGSIILFLALKQKNILLLGILFFLILKIKEEIEKHDMIVNKFQLERFLYHIRFFKYRTIKGIYPSKMKRDYSHIFKCKEKIWSEQEILRKKFDFH